MATEPPAAPSSQGLPDPVPQVSDHSLLRRFRRGSQDAATQLYLRYVHRLRALVRANCSSQLTRRLEPEDIVQSVFRRFFRRVLKGDYDVPPGEELWGLFLVIALNKIRAEEAFHRAGKRDVRLTIDAGKAGILSGSLPGCRQDRPAHPPRRAGSCELSPPAQGTREVTIRRALAALGCRP